MLAQGGPPPGLHRAAIPAVASERAGGVTAAGPRAEWRLCAPAAAAAAASSAGLIMQPRHRHSAAVCAPS